MFKHLLIPTDGSVLAYKTIQAAVDFARETGARVTGYHALPMCESAAGDDEIDRETSAEYERRARHEGQLSLDVIGNAARAQKVPCDLVMAVAKTAYGGIIETASDRGCDLIFHRVSWPNRPSGENPRQRTPASGGPGRDTRAHISHGVSGNLRAASHRFRAGTLS